MTHKEVMQQALEALEGWENHGKWVWPESALESCKRNTVEALAALRKALEQPEQEPVAWMLSYSIDRFKRGYIVEVSRNQAAPDDIPLYTTPPAAQPEQRKPLTTKEINALPEAKGYWPIGMNDRIVRLIRAVEAAHGIKENT